MMDVEFIGQSVEYVGGYGGAANVESAARTCTQTGNKGKATEFVRRLVEHGHMSPLEFGFADMLIECDRGIQQELTRHRHFSFNVESTRYCDYRRKPLRFVTKPPKGMDVPPACIHMLERHCERSAREYEALIELGAPRDYARKVLPLCTASKMRMAGNIRTWLEMLPKRLSPAAHPEIREVAGTILERLTERFPGIFDGIDNG
jgi:thymidylate synthase (FAD)